MECVQFVVFDKFNTSLHQIAQESCCYFLIIYMKNSSRRVNRQNFGCILAICICTWVTNLHSWCMINVLILSQSDKCNFFMYIIRSQREKIKEVLKISKTVVVQQKHTLCNQRTSQKTPLNSVTNSIQSTKLTCNINSLQMGKKVMMTAVIFLKSFSPNMHTNSKISTSACKIYKTTKGPSKDQNYSIYEMTGMDKFLKDT